MKKTIALPILWVCLILTVVQAKTTDLPFYNGSMSQLQEQARLSRVPYMVYFYVLECEPCRKMQKESFNHEPLQRYMEAKYMAYRVDGLDFLSGIDIAKKYGVKSYPTTLIFGPDGEIRKRTEGFISGPELTKDLMQARRSADRDVSSQVLASRSAPTTQSNSRTAPPANTANRSSSSNGGSALPGWATSRSSNGNDNLFSSSLPTSDTRGNASNSGSNQPAVDKRGYVSEYLDYKSNQPASNPGDSYYSSDRNRPAYNTGSNYQSGSSRGNTGSANSGNNPGYVNPYAPPQYGGNSNNNQQYSNNQSQNDPNGSFLDPVDVAAVNQGGLPDYVWNGDQWVTRNSLPAGAQLYLGADGDWHVSNTTSDGSNMRTRGADAPASDVPVETFASVPGLAAYAPKQLQSESFGLLVGEYDAITNVKAGLDEFKAQNPGIPVWVYAERKGTNTIYKLAMGVYSSPDAATTDAMARGADWDEIRVVQLTGL
ncbi:MAG: thioredoxin family protein [Bacteroidia bacterium]